MYTEVSKGREGHQMSSLWGENDRDLAHVGGNMQFSTSSPATGPRVSRMLVAYSPHEINLIVWPWVNVKLMNKMQNNNSMCKRNSAMIPIPIRQRIHLYIPPETTSTSLCVGFDTDQGFLGHLDGSWYFAGVWHKDRLRWMFF